MTSMTRPTSLELGLGVDRAAAARGSRRAAAASRRPRSTRLSRLRADLRHAALERGLAGVAQVDAVAGAGGHFGDAAAHRAGADDDDGLVGRQRAAGVSVDQPLTGSVCWKEGACAVSAYQSARRGAMVRQPKASKR